MFKALLILLIFFSSVSLVSASDFRPENYYDWSNWKGELVLATATSSAQAKLNEPEGLLPDNFFYFLKSWSENISLAFTFDIKAKEVKRLELAEERLSEAEELLEKGKFDLVSKNFSKYQSSLLQVTKTLDNLDQAHVQIEVLAQKLEYYSAKHSLILEDLKEKIPPNLTNDLEMTLGTSLKSLDLSADKLGKSPLPLELANRLKDLQELGLLSATEISTLESLSSREAVRSRLEELAKQNSLPASDLKKLDEAQQSYFPIDYAKVSEAKKLQELNLLENQKPDEQTMKKLTKFSEKHQQDEPIPQDLKKWWPWWLRYQELHTTLRPELVTPKTPLEEKKIEKKSEQPPTFPSPKKEVPKKETSLPKPDIGSQCKIETHAIGTIFGDGSCYFLRCEGGWYNNDLEVKNGCESTSDLGVTPAPGTASAGICGSGQVKNSEGVCVPENQTCTDTNSSVPFYTTGSCSDSGGTFANYCEGSVAKDYMCEGTWDPQTLSSKDHRCVVHSFDCGTASTVENYTCSSGGCVKPP